MTDTLEKIAEEVRACAACELHHSRALGVPGVGPANAEIMFIGEGPGFHENQQGQPFVGAAGDYLNELLQLIGLSRQDTFITNVVKCRPPGNRDPLPEEIEACKAFLDRQIVLINPKMIITLGRYSMARWFPSARISKVHGQARRMGGRLIYPMYHPAAALHQPSLRPLLEEDFRRIPELLRQVDSIAEAAEDEEPPEEQPRQLSLF